MLLSTFRKSLLHAQEDRLEHNATLLPVCNDENAAKRPEKPKRGRLPREKSMIFRFSRADSPPILVSERDSHGRDGIVALPGVGVDLSSC